MVVVIGSNSKLGAFAPLIKRLEDFVEDPKSRTEEGMLCRQAVDSLFMVRDSLVELSQSLQDLLFETDLRGRREAREIAEDAMQAMKR
jgi:hypothetical protein